MTYEERVHLSHKAMATVVVGLIDQYVERFGSEPNLPFPPQQGSNNAEWLRRELKISMADFELKFAREYEKLLRAA